MTPDDMKQRTREFGLRIVRLVESLPSSRTANVIGGQLLRCGMSVGANYRASCRAKMRIVEEEADEAVYWMEMLIDCGLVRENLVQPLLSEANEIVSIVVSSIRTARSNGARSSGKSAIRIPQSAI